MGDEQDRTALGGVQQVDLRRLGSIRSPWIWTRTPWPASPAFYGVVIYMYWNERDHPAGTIVWPDGIDLAPEPLYEQAKAYPLVAA